MKIKDAALLLLCICLNASAQSMEPFGANTTSAAPAAGQPLTISLKGNWRFASDAGDQGATEKWFADGFDDSSWKTLTTGKAWSLQGVEQTGYGWFRQKISVSKELAGVPMMLQLGDNQSDDDVWLNGVRVGGAVGPYKYKNIVHRLYAVPASVLHYGALNTITIRVWGGRLGFTGVASEGLVEGNFAATFDPSYVSMRKPGGTEQLAQLFDLSDAQQGKPFEIIFHFPGDKIADTATLQCDLKDFYKGEIATLQAQVEKAADGTASAVVKIDPSVAQTIYLRGRFQAVLNVQDSSGNPIITVTKDLDHLSFDRRDTQPLPALADTSEDTPYGKLKLVDEIDCSVATDQETHPYLQSGFSHQADFMTPGPAVNVTVDDILGKKARQSENGWFAYRIGRDKLKPHSNYLLRIEYAEDKPRYCPIEIQAGRTYLDVGWQNGVGEGDPYDPWPLSNAYQWYDTMVSLDENTTGTSGSYGAPIDNGFWVYFMNKVTPGKYYTMYDGGPAISRMKLYEIDAEKNAPVINPPSGLPQRVLMFDWERQPEANPEDLTRFAKLMGYNAVSPVIIKWSFSNWSDPLSGYTSTGEDAKEYWEDAPSKPGTEPEPAITGQESQHIKYLAATKRYGIQYIPRFEYGGSMDLPVEAHAIDKNGKTAKPDRYGTWGCDILNPATTDDIQKLMDHLIKPYVKDNPQLTGALWRSRCDRMQISYAKYDLDLYATDKGDLPAGSEAEQRAWASTGAGKAAYDDWWLEKRAQFHAKVEAMLQSYRPDMKLYYYNWDGDKFGLGLVSMTSWAFNKQIAFSKEGGADFTKGGGKGREVYEKDREDRKKLTGDDYVKIMHSGAFLTWGTDRADYAMRPELYKNIKGIEIMCPANALWASDDPTYLNYFQTAEGLAVSNAVMYDEIGARTINPRYEGSCTTPASSAFSMALELMDYFHGDARTLTYTTYTYGRGFADAHRRFAQAFLALPALPATVVDQGDQDLKVRTYSSANGTYVGVAYKGFAAKKFTVSVPGAKPGAVVTNLVTNEAVPSQVAGNNLQFDVNSGPMELNAFLIK
jgi:hypothetical protein